MSHMTRKQALAVLAQLREAYLHEIIAWQVEHILARDGGCPDHRQQYEQKEAQFKQAREALAVLAGALHGKPDWHEHSFLCERCSLHYAIVGTFGTYRAFLCRSCVEKEQFARTVAPVVAVERGMSLDEAYQTIIAC